MLESLGLSDTDAGRVELLIADDMAKAPSLIKSPPCSAPPTEVPMRPEPTNAPAALSRRFSVAPMMDRSNYKKLPNKII
ncbi:hypothetical protein APB42_32665 [Pseudomonas aeruginosa]|nr:hypothetical protein APB42_32665 [Pseudomonas aeruginosa]